MYSWEAYRRLGERRQRLVRRSSADSLRQAVAELHGVMVDLPAGAAGRGYVFRSGGRPLVITRCASGGVYWSGL